MYQYIYIYEKSQTYYWVKYELQQIIQYFRNFFKISISYISSMIIFRYVRVGPN